MKLQKLLSLTRKAVDEFRLIDPGDKIAVGISGGKDSLAMLYALCGLKRFYPNPFTLEAITVDLGHPGFHPEKIQSLCESLEIPFTLVRTDIAPIIFQERKESNPCSLCAKMRKGALNQAAKDLGCNKIAYAHHKEDVVETMLLSLIYEGRFHTFSPKTYLDRMELTVIRPLLFVDEADIIGFKNKYQLPVEKSPCPVDGYTKRQYAKDLLKTLNHDSPGVRERMFTAILNSGISGWDLRTVRSR
ncbi:MAG TPA: tRNA 2-thiocytidine(32) synthetase TtcA [Candidatus Blautia merdavium]|uniref:tRNA 2-thiocytidine(32) synthetase TtcA n=1 Tax=Candidatus Blautia merdavium TaxID=2838494 RepID=A0A9D2TBM9_9FIRM|nr:tRNA 2-thiocytidine(32) synthetase TtcA [Candidatus Blautia merdavium]